MQPSPEQLTLGSPQSLPSLRGMDVELPQSPTCGLLQRHSQEPTQPMRTTPCTIAATPEEAARWTLAEYHQLGKIHAQQVNVAQLTQPLGRDGDIYMTNPVLNTTPITSRSVTWALGPVPSTWEEPCSSSQRSSADSTPRPRRLLEDHMLHEETMEQREPALKMGCPKMAVWKKQ